MSDFPTPDFDAPVGPLEATFLLHNEHGHCYCATCEIHRWAIDQTIVEDAE
jgi:hypothetical protein